MEPFGLAFFISLSSRDFCDWAGAAIFYRSSFFNDFGFICMDGSFDDSVEPGDMVSVSSLWETVFFLA